MIVQFDVASMGRLNTIDGVWDTWSRMIFMTTRWVLQFYTCSFQHMFIAF